MFRKSFLLLISFIIATVVTVNAQEATNNLPPVDTIHNQLAINLINKIIKKDFSDPLFNRITVLGNPSCGHCLEIETMMKEKNMSFDIYDLRDNKLLMRIHDLIASQSGNPNGPMAYSFPIIIYKGEVSFNFKDAKAFVEELNLKTKQ